MDYSINLPAWAIQKGYTLEGMTGQYDYLYLYRDGKTKKIFEWNKIPNIFEIEEIIVSEAESQETT